MTHSSFLSSYSGSANPGEPPGNSPPSSFTKVPMACPTVVRSTKIGLHKCPTFSGCEALCSRIPTSSYGYAPPFLQQSLDVYGRDYTPNAQSPWPSSRLSILSHWMDAYASSSHCSSLMINSGEHPLTAKHSFRTAIYNRLTIMGSQEAHVGWKVKILYVDQLWNHTAQGETKCMHLYNFTFCVFYP